MSTARGRPRPAATASVAAFVADRHRLWRTGTPRGQRWALGALAAGVLTCLGVSLLRFEWMPVTAYAVWLLAGLLVLRFGPLVVHACLCLAAGVAAVLVDAPVSQGRLSALLALLVAVVLVLVHAARQRTGLPAIVGEAMLVDLRDRLQAQSTVPPLPRGWRAESATLAADGVAYAGDFLVAELDREGRHLEMILVDVCGKGVQAGPQALSFAGALAGLLGALPPKALMTAANDYLLRRHDDGAFATAVHVRVDLVDGGFAVLSAGHPPALRYDASSRAWLADPARGTALGVDPDPELVESRGVLGPGEALMFYTDGVIESREADLDAGLEWLCATAGRVVASGFAGAPRRILRQVRRGDDDRAVLVLSRDA
ncbi:PP2C family protein-serine/threonine phosphatase [Nocardioides zeae]|uniref:PP2C family protein-serine/threonine phosphatase n=1 Tax=Nocardioides imazamoxiresistens TaxID=3231893 RepID=A0ABU3PT96_9ACTN|nr:PP2C family protein-serine/threonine phosphatase [Nocardioides zeae]MDT9592409.1 PP2C family protein-serine/threonine phosphatase [Nocardioides zeae]